MVWPILRGWFSCGGDINRLLSIGMGQIPQAEIESLKPKTWEIPKKNLPYSGRRQ
ncbi:MAG: hypothetical protein ACETWM_17185 [Candidatus Lokiarchaeia archaeon]